MFTLLITVLFGILFAYLAGQNTAGVTVHLFSFRSGNIPLYLVSLISLLIGVALSWGISLVNWAGTAFTLMGKNSAIRQKDTKISELEKRIDELEAQNTRLKEDTHDIRENAN